MARFYITVVSWKGKTVYRKCSCGETAHDAVYACTSEHEKTEEGFAKKFFFYKCRNCYKLAQFVK